MKIQLHTTCGQIMLALHQDKAPVTVENFIAYIKSGHYDDTIFHRVINDFMIQGGGMDANMREKETREPIKNEADNGLCNTLGTIAMARLPDPHSASAQFFINTSDNGFLDFSAKTDEGWGYCVFGEVVEGMDVVEAIEAVPTTTKDMHQDVPTEAIIITRAEITET